MAKQQRTTDEYDPAGQEPERAIVKFYNARNGYGFVCVADPENHVLADLFIHSSALIRSGIEMIRPQQILVITRGVTPKDQPCVWQILKIESDSLIL